MRREVPELTLPAALRSEADARNLIRPLRLSTRSCGPDSFQASLTTPEAGTRKRFVRSLMYRLALVRTRATERMPILPASPGRAPKL